MTGAYILSIPSTSLYWSGFKQEFFGVDPASSGGMTDSCDTVTHPNLCPGGFWGGFRGDSGVKIGFSPQFRPSFAQVALYA